MPKLIIDGKPIEVPANTMVVEAAKLLGIQIPVFCYHPKLEPVGMCRMCLVEVGTPKMDPATRKPVLDDKGAPVIAWMPKLQTACTTAVSEGMAVRTTTPAVAEARRSVIEFLLTSHPLDCPICDKGGECPLQEHTLAHGPGVSRFRVESKFHNEKHVPLGPLVVLDRERCIQCSRCIRFQDEYADDPVLGFADRGRALEIVTLSDPPFDSKYSGNTIDICPVGALTSHDFRLTARVFELTDHPSVCAHCSVGCNMFIGERDHEIKRITPRENEAVNEIWLCDKGRFVHQQAHSPERITKPMMRTGSEWTPVSWYDAITAIASRFTGTRLEYGGSAFAGLAGDRVANEDLYLFQKLFREVLGSNNIEHRIGWSQWNAGDELVRNYGAAAGTDLGSLGKSTAVLVLGADPEEEQPVLRLRLSKAARQGATLIVANGRLTKLARHAKQGLIYRYGREVQFLLAFLRVMVDENLCKGDLPAAFKAGLSQRTLQDYAEQCGIAAETLQAAARAFASSENGLILFGRELMFAMQQDPAIEVALAALAVAAGHIGRKDNGVIALYPHNNSQGAFDMGITPDRGPGGVALKDKGQALKDIVGGKPRALYVMGCDPARDVPGFRRAGFMVVQDLFMTDTARQADIVLPAQSWAEREGTFTNTERRVQLFRAATKPLGETRPDWSALNEIARALDARWSYTSPAEIMREIAGQVPGYAGMTYDRLAMTAQRRASVLTVGAESVEPVQIAMGEIYGHVSGVCWPSRAEADAAAKFELAWVEPQAAPQEPKDYALAISRSLYDAGTLAGQTAIVQSRVPAVRVELNAHDAEDLGIADGSKVKLTLDVKPARALELAAHVNGHVPPGVVLVPNNLDGTYNLPMGARAKVEKVAG
ncbi:MAG: NADH-quinone oxidoreductase subunit NuoG [Anaerolineae bacterium]